ncbi:MAG TPA: histidine kinase [Usitatibacter sp.]|nr:histidine kinase [Usitatibacter sp.]
MKLGDLLHRTPWWALLLGGFALLATLGLFATPIHLIELEHSGATPEENRAIRREIDSTFSEGVIDFVSSIFREMRSRTRDPARLAALDRALREMGQARESLREAGTEATRAKREAAESAAGAVREAAQAIEEARHEAAQALKDAQVEKEVEKSLAGSLSAAEKAEKEALEGAAEAPPGKPPATPATPSAKATPPPAAPPGKAPSPPAAPVPESAAPEVSVSPGHIVVGPFPGHPAVEIRVDKDEEPGATPVVPLPPELRAQIRQKVTGDLYRIGVGTALILIFIPLFILAVVSKIFIDRSRAAQQVADLKRREAEYHRMGRQVTEAKLSALQAQVEPHFLYNTLASVQALTETDPQRASAMTGHLIQYLRNALPKMRESVSTVGQEVELARAYLSILQMRMGPRLAFEISMPPELAETPFPPLMLPSLVENAIKHGLEPQREGGTVAIAADAVDGRLRVTVTDTGRGFAEAPGQGVGLANIRERLGALYGEAGKLTLEANEPHGVRATIEVPRDGARAQPSAAGPKAAPKAAPPAGAAARTLAVVGSAERAWRKGLSFAFIVLVCVAAVAAGLAIVGVATGVMPVRIGDQALGGPTGTLIGTAGIAVAFVVAVLALAIVLAVVYGLGFLLVGLALFIPVAILVSLFPVLAPYILVGLGIWWLVRRSRRKKDGESAVQPGAAAPGAAPPGASPPSAP